MTFHSTTYPRIREMAGTVSIEHIATLHYSDTNRAIGDTTAVVVDKDMEKVIE